MATNIVLEDNLDKITIHSTVMKYDKERTQDLLSKTDTTTVVVFKDDEGEYLDGKISVSNESAILYDYNYRRDSDGNIVDCTVEKSFVKNGQSNDYEKVTTRVWYDENGHVSKQEWYTREGITYRREMFTYWDNGCVKKKAVKSNQTITTSEYNRDGKLILEWNETIKSHAVHKRYTATYDNKGNLIHYVDNNKRMEVFVESDIDHEGNILSTTKIFKHTTGDKRVFAKTTEVYDPYAGFQLSRVIKNGYVVEQRWYDLKGELVKMFLKQDESEVVTRISKSIDNETGNKTIDTNSFITTKDGKQNTKYTRKVFDKDGNLISYSEDNSKVTEYTYNADGKRESAITKQLVGDDFVVIDEINYTYEVDEETGKSTKVRVETRYDAKGNVTYKQTHTEVESGTEEKYIVEQRAYHAPKDDCCCNQKPSDDEEEDTTPTEPDEDDNSGPKVEEKDGELWIEDTD